MKKYVFFLALMGCASLNLASVLAANSTYQKVSETYLQEGPPADKQENPTPAPKGGDYVWIPGCWIWQGKWIWNNGHWEKKPNPNAVWEKCYWAHTPQGWYFVEGHWVY